MTVDLPILGRRLNEYRNNFSIPEGLGVPNQHPAVGFGGGKKQDPRGAYGTVLKIAK